MLKRSNILIDAGWEGCLRQHGLDTTGFPPCRRRNPGECVVAPVSADEG